MKRPGVAVAAVGIAAVAIAVFFLAIAAWRPGTDDVVTNPTDFRAFYCGGAALRDRRDPYRVEPMRTCQRDLMRAAGLRLNAAHVLPAPLPPYALAAFAGFALAPYRIASALWLALLAASVCVAAAGLRILSGLRPLPVAAAGLGALACASLPTAQLVPVAVAALVWAAVAARHGCFATAACAVSLAAVEPHLALPAWLGLAAALPRARAPLAVAGLALVAASLAAGAALDAEYLHDVLPEHARSEVANFPAQYSLSSLLWRLGTPASSAVALGSASYAATAAAGVLIARALVRVTGDGAFAVTVPIAAAVALGPFVHAHQFAAALPLALMLFARAGARTAAKPLLLAAAIAFAVPWEAVAESPFVADRGTRTAALGPEPQLHAAAAGESLEIPYTAFVDAYANRADRRGVLEQFAWKAPTWAALAAVLARALALARRPAGSPPRLR